MRPVTLAALAVVLASGTYPDAPRRYEFTERHMGTTFRVVAFASDSAVAAAGAAAAFGVVAALDASFSDYDPGSEVARLGEVAGSDASREVSRELWEILAIAQGWSERTGGAFDATVGPLTRLWRWSARRGELPDSARLAAARRAVGWRQLELDGPGRRVRLLRPGMAIDLGGIAKGFAADAALAELSRRGLPAALVDAGGDLALGAPPPGERGWRIRLDGPDGRTLRLAEVAIATSGDRYRFFEAEGVRYSHLIDPRTGLGVSGAPVITVIAPDATTADVLASALSVLDQEAGRALVRSVPGAILHQRREDP